MATPGRRQFLGGLLAATALPMPSWADAGAPAYLAAAHKPAGDYVLCGLGPELTTLFELPLPARGHAAAAHPTRPEAVAFARRPGTFALVIDCATGRVSATLTAPEGRHFYGHGAFSADGRLLYTTENDYDSGLGRIGVWDAESGYVRIAEWDSGGVGPHDIKRLPGSDVLVVANGGIETHPDTGRAKLNLPTMRSTLAYIQNGKVLEAAALGPAHQRNSIRHLDVAQDGRVAFGMQWQGDDPDITLAGVHQRGAEITLLKAEPAQWRSMHGYVGSIAMSRDGGQIAMTSPRGDQLMIFDADGQLLSQISETDICGVAASDTGFVATTGLGHLLHWDGQRLLPTSERPLAWDNHLVPIG